MMMHAVGAFLAAAAAVMPTPQSMERGADGRFAVDGATPFVVGAGGAPGSMALIEEALGAAPRIVPAAEARASDRAVFVGTYDDHELMSERRLHLMLRALLEPGPQGYRLVVNDDAAVVAGADAAGVHNGLAALAQLLEENPTLPEIAIYDQPDQLVRGVVLACPFTADDVRRLALGRCNWLGYRDPAHAETGALELAAQLGMNVQRLPEKGDGRPRALAMPGPDGPIAVTIGHPEFNAAAGYAWCAEAAREDRPTGFIVRADSLHFDDWETLEQIFEKAWSVKTPQLAWPEGLNAYFGASLWRPQPAAARTAIIDHVNRETLQGARPGDQRSAFADAEGPVKYAMPDGNPELAYAAAFHGVLMEYLELEARYNANPSGGAALGRLEGLVERQGEINPDWPAGRTESILETMEATGFFVPSSILFGKLVFPYREGAPPDRHWVLPYPAEPDYAYTDHSVTATFDFGGSIGPIRRIDFEAVGINNVRVEAEGNELAALRADPNGRPEGVAGPAIIPRPEAHPALTVAGEGAGRTVLRSVQASGIKAVAADVCSDLPRAPEIDGAAGGGEWGNPAMAQAFVRTDEASFAMAQSSVWMGQRDGVLYLYIDCHEPRMGTMATTGSRRDAPHWEREAFEFKVARPGGDLSFFINPDNGQADAREGDAEWDADWESATRLGDDGWTAELAIPFEALGGAPAPGETWRANFVRYRYNVFKETSAWAVTADGEGAADPTGRIAF